MVDTLVREKLTGAEPERVDHIGSRDQKIPIQKTQSFKGDALLLL